MFDLKAKLLAKGLVTKEQVDKITVQKNVTKPKKEVSFQVIADIERKKAVTNLQKLPKNEQYALIRKWVEKNRLDKTIDVNDEKFFFTDQKKEVSWLSLSTFTIEKIKAGQAGIISFMSHHGMASAVVERDIAEDVATVFPDWLLVLNDIILSEID